MRKYLVLFVSVISAAIFVGCDSDDFNEPDYVSFETNPSGLVVDFGGSATYDVTVFAGSISSSDRSFDLEVDTLTTLSSQAYVVPASVTIPGGTNEGVFTVEVSDIDISPNGETLRLGFAPRQSGFVGADITINVSQFCDPQLMFDFVFDGYASETTWQVEDTEGNIVLSGGGFSNGTATASVGRCINPGDYIFTVFDEYGDGMTYDGAEGSVTISYGGEELAFVDGDFGSEASTPFSF